MSVLPLPLSPGGLSSVSWISLCLLLIILLLDLGVSTYSRWSHLKLVTELHLQEPCLFFQRNLRSEVLGLRTWTSFFKEASFTLHDAKKQGSERGSGSCWVVRSRAGPGWPLSHPAGCCISWVQPRFSEQGVFTWVPAKKHGSLEQWLATRHLTRWPPFSQSYIFSGGILPATPHMTLLSS